MKKVFIIGLILLILILGGVWAYLLLHGAPESVADIRDTIFGGEGASVPTAPDMPNDLPPAEDLGATARIVQTHVLLSELTDRKVAGAVIVVSTTSAGFVRYMEKGTGNIFEIALDSGVETRISNQTIPYVVEAIWARTGDQVVFSTEIAGTRGKTYFGTLTVNDAGETIFDAEVSSDMMDNSAFSNDGDFLFYSERDTAGGTTGFVRAKKTGIATPLFSLPFSESVVLWDTGTASSTHYAFSKPALGYQGYLYEIDMDGTLTKIDSGLALSALRHDNYLIVNKNSGKGPYSLLINTDGGPSRFLSIETLTEKCDGNGDIFWCGASASAQVTTFPIDWYQGAISYADQLWRVDARTGDARMVTDPEPISREQLDVENPQVADGGTSVIFRNKRNDSLWLYNPPQ